jgi:alkylation response protein AidB-like acyl-CoA dehydrogenase
VVNGQKTWTTYAQYADWIFCLVRTDASVKKQAGISFLLIDMKTPGVEVKPMLTMGGTPAFCETFFENVKVPKENLVGPLSTAAGPWPRRSSATSAPLIAAVGQSCRRLRRQLKRIAAAPGRAGRCSRTRLFRRASRASRCACGADEMANYRTLAGAARQAPGPESSILKLRGSEILQQCYELAWRSWATTR